MIKFDENDMRTPLERTDYSYIGTNPGANRNTVGKSTVDNTDDDIVSSFGIRNYPLASVYSPIQSWADIYEPEKALNMGTMFQSLDLPLSVLNHKGGINNG